MSAARILEAVCTNERQKCCHQNSGEKKPEHNYVYMNVQSGFGLSYVQLEGRQTQ